MRSTPPRHPLATSRRRSLPATTGPAALALAAVLAASIAAPATAQTEEAARKITGYYEMPFPCGQEWTGKTRGSHSPSSNAIDWNRPDDDGDEVVAAAAGTVTVANTTGVTGYGRWVRLTHLGGETTVYSHLSTVSVSVGQTVDQGVVIGYVGSTGNSSGPHLHFEQRIGTAVSQAVFGGQSFAYGSSQVSRNCVDVPLAANMVGTAASEMVVFRKTKKAKFVVKQPGGAPIKVPFGRTSDDPLLGDWDGDGTANVGVRRPAESMFYLATPGGVGQIALGDPSDRPIAGDWNGDRLTDIGVRRPSTATFYLRAGDGSLSTVVLGDADDIAVTGDWNGDGVTDLGVYDSATATYTLRQVGADGVPVVVSMPFGNPGDLPVTGDWDGNGLSDLGVWRPSLGTFLARRAPNAETAARMVSMVRFGNPRR